MKRFQELFYLLGMSVALLVGCSTSSKLRYSTYGSNVLYAGIGNPIYIHSDGKKPITLTTNNGIVAHQDSNRYLIYPDTVSGELILTIVQANDKKEVKFRVKRIPSIKTIAKTDSTNYKSTVLSSDNFRTFTSLLPVILDFDIECVATMLRYQITRIAKDGTVVSETNEVIQYLYNGSQSHSHSRAQYLAKKAMPGDVYIFENIEILISSLDKSKPKYTRKLDDVIYYIK